MSTPILSTLLTTVPIRDADAVRFDALQGAYRCESAQIAQVGSWEASIARWPLVVLALLIALAGSAFLARDRIAVFLQPPRPATPSAPPPPVQISLGGTTLSVPRELIRVEGQRAGGAQSRLDLMFQWPSLRPAPSDRPTNMAELVFVSLTPKDEALDPPRRLMNIYNRFLETEVRTEGFGLSVRRFRAGSGYDGEDLVFDPARPGAFFMRCAPASGEAPATCLRELRLADRLDVVVRFPRPLLEDWRRLDQSVGALLGAIGAPMDP